MKNNLYLLCGSPGSGKTYWAMGKSHGENYVSRDEIRFAKIQDGSDYFAYEDIVFKEFIDTISRYMLDKCNTKDIYIDATHLTPKSRAKVLNKLPIEKTQCKVIAVNFLTSRAQCLERNDKREGFAHVPEGVLIEMNRSFIPATNNDDREPIHYDAIVNIKEGGVVDVDLGNGRFAL